MKYLVTLTLVICSITQVYSIPIENKSDDSKKCEELCSMPSVNGVLSIFKNPEDFVFINGVASEEFRKKNVVDVLTEDAFNETARNRQTSMAAFCDFLEEAWRGEVEYKPELKFASFKNGECVCEK